MPELILSLRERELGRFAVTSVRTIIGRDPSCDVVIDNAGVSRQHAVLAAVGDGFVIEDCGSQNGITVNGEASNQARLVHGDVVGINKFLIRFSNRQLDVPDNLQSASQKPPRKGPQDIQRTVHLDAGSVEAFAAVAKEQIARQRAELAARGGDSLGPPLDSERPVAPPPSRGGWEESERPKRKWGVFLGGVVVGAALIAGLIFGVL